MRRRRVPDRSARSATPTSRGRGALSRRAAPTSICSSRCGRPAPTWCASSSATCRTLACDDGEGRALPVRKVDKAHLARRRARRQPRARALPRLRLRSDGAHRAPRRHARLLERRLRLPLHRRAARSARARHRRCRRQGWHVTVGLDADRPRPTPSSRATTTSWSTRRSRSARTSWSSFDGAGQAAPPGHLGPGRRRRATTLRRDFTKIIDAAHGAVRRAAALPRLHVHPACSRRTVRRARARALVRAALLAVHLRAAQEVRGVPRAGLARVLPPVERQAHPPRGARPVRLPARGLHPLAVGDGGRDQLLRSLPAGARRAAAAQALPREARRGAGQDRRHPRAAAARAWRSRASTPGSSSTAPTRTR